MSSDKLSKAILASVGVYFIWGFTFFASSIAQRTASPMVFLMYRFDIAALLMLIPLFFGKRKLVLRGKKVSALLLMGLSEPVLYFIGEQYGLKYSSSSFSGIFISIIPLFNMLLAYIFFRERPSFLQWFFCIVSICGVVAISIFTSQAGGTTTLRGVLWLTLAVICSGAYTVCNKKASADNFGVYERTVITIAEGAVFFSLCALIENRTELSALITPLSSTPFVLSALYVAVLASVLGYTLLNYALDNAPVTNVVSLNGLVTVISIIVGVVLLKEQFSFRAATAMLVVLIGVWGVQKFTPEYLKK